MEYVNSLEVFCGWNISA